MIPTRSGADPVGQRARLGASVTSGSITVGVQNTVYKLEERPFVRIRKGHLLSLLPYR